MPGTQWFVLSFVGGGLVGLDPQKQWSCIKKQGSELGSWYMTYVHITRIQAHFTVGYIRLIISELFFCTQLSTLL